MNLKESIEKIARSIENTILKPDETQARVDQFIDSSLSHAFYSLCVHPCWVRHVKERLAGSPTGVTTVIGFPLGANCVSTKVFEAQKALEHGADEVDMVFNIGLFKSGRFDEVKNEIKAIKEACQGRLLKVIVETALLTGPEKERAVQLVIEGGADFIKTSTGFASSGADAADIRLFRSIAGKQLKIKASGGVSSYEKYQLMIEAGADLIGTSNGIGIIEGYINSCQ